MRKVFVCWVALIALLGVAGMLIPACGNDPLPVVIDADPRIDAPVCMGTLAFLAVCVNNADCAGSCLCKNFGHEKVCSKTCTTSAECPAPSGGCSQNICQP